MPSIPPIFFITGLFRWHKRYLVCGNPISRSHGVHFHRKVVNECKTRKKRRKIKSIDPIEIGRKFAFRKLERFHPRLPRLTKPILFFIQKNSV